MENGLTHSPAAPGLWVGADHLPRCAWCKASSIYTHYHDEEWGFATVDDRTLFEKLCLEGFQAGLSWLTILNKREGFRRAFDQFDADKIARYDAADVHRLVGDAAIVRHRGKIESTINNAKRMLELVDEFGSLCTYAWLFEPKRRDRPSSLAELRLRSNCVEAKQLSGDLKRRGWTFVGPTTMYAFMQAMGLVNDHLRGCVIGPRAHSARLELGLHQD
jgi:DNA-3-methyladenine glycosylase I